MAATSAGPSVRRSNVTVHPEQVVRIVLPLDLGEAVEVGAVGGLDTVLALVRGLEVDVGAAGRKGSDPLPRIADPPPERGRARFVWLPLALHTDYEACVTVPDGPVVSVAVVEGPAEVMRFVLVDYARERTSLKRGGGYSQIPLDDVQIAADERAIDLLALTDALDQLASVSTRLSDIVDYRFFGGLTFDEIAEVTGRSVPTVKRDWARARAWLYRSMQAAADSPL